MSEAFYRLEETLRMAFFLPVAYQLHMQLKSFTHVELLDIWKQALLMDDLEKMLSSLSSATIFPLKENTVLRELTLRITCGASPLECFRNKCSEA